MGERKEGQYFLRKEAGMEKINKLLKPVPVIEGKFLNKNNNNNNNPSYYFQIFSLF